MQARALKDPRRSVGDDHGSCEARREVATVLLTNLGQWGPTRGWTFPSIAGDLHGIAHTVEGILLRVAVVDLLAVGP